MSRRLALALALALSGCVGGWSGHVKGGDEAACDALHSTTPDRLRLMEQMADEAIPPATAAYEGRLIAADLEAGAGRATNPELAHVLGVIADGYTLPADQVAAHRPEIDDAGATARRLCPDE